MRAHLDNWTMKVKYFSCTLRRLIGTTHLSMRCLRQHPIMLWAVLNLSYFRHWLVKTLTLSEDKRWRVESNTHEQNQCKEWYEIRKHRLTASNFGKVLTGTNSKHEGLVKQILYSQDSGYIPAIIWGREKEATAVSTYIDHHKKNGNGGSQSQGVDSLSAKPTHFLEHHQIGVCMTHVLQTIHTASWKSNVHIRTEKSAQHGHAQTRAFVTSLAKTIFFIWSNHTNTMHQYREKWPLESEIGATLLCGQPFMKRHTWKSSTQTGWILQGLHVLHQRLYRQLVNL